MNSKEAPSTETTELKPKGRWRVTNWPEYDRALVKRGSLTVWFDPAFVSEHWRPDPTGKRGAPRKYSDVAIQVLLMLKMTFNLTYRSLEGFARSLMQLMNLDFEVPDHSHMARRAQTLQVAIPCKPRTEPTKQSDCPWVPWVP